MPTTFVRHRVTATGRLRFAVLYRVGGRGTPLLSAGTFATLPEAATASETVRLRLAGATMPTNGGSVERVYFAELGNRIKIGISIDPARRCRALGATLLRVEYGGRERERELHERFAALRTRGEWFRDDVAIRDYLFQARWAT